MRSLLVAVLVITPLLAGCVNEAESPDIVVPYPHMGDVVTYEATGALVEFARWENAHAFVTPTAKVRFTLAASQPVIDGARDVHPVFRVTTDLAEAGPFVKHSERYVSLRHQQLVQAYYPVSTDQGVLSFDERGFPWLFGASALIGAQLSRHASFPFTLLDNLGRDAALDFAWVIDGEDMVDGTRATKLRLEGSASLTGSVWMDGASAYPLRIKLDLHDDGLAPHVRADGQYPVSLDARRTGFDPGSEALPPRTPGASWGEDLGVERVPWDGESPPDGDAGYIAYTLGDAIGHVKLLDRALVDWLAAAKDPRVYRGTYQDEMGPIDGTTTPSWLIQFVDQDERYYEVEVERITFPASPQGIPRVVRSVPADAPQGENHGWFSAADVPATFVPLAEGVRVMKEVFGVEDVQIFLRSLQRPAGYSYYIDGGFEAKGGRFTVVYAPNTGFIEEATGPVSVRFAN